MRYNHLISVLPLLIALNAPAIENSMLNLERPAALESGQSQFLVQHRFYGAVDDQPLDSFFGLSEGATVDLGFRISPLKKLEIRLHHTFLNNEYRVGAGYSFFPLIPGCRAQAGVDWVSFKSGRFVEGYWREDRESVWFGRVELQAPTVARLTPVANAGFDSDSRKTGFGIGLDCAVSGSVSLIGEFFPRADRSTWEGERSENCFAAGLQFRTYGHHFLFQIGNSTDIGLRRMMRGAPNRDLKFGFGIKRLFE
ncbi:MAG: DUF5777 family beta-barrel protein [bacterium]|nr:DUF5777 family beta-barrel protein [bacterium]